MDQKLLFIDILVPRSAIMPFGYGTIAIVFDIPEDTYMQSDYARISQTADFVAIMRVQLGIPYADLLAVACSDDENVMANVVSDKATRARLALRLESRYRLVRRFVSDTGVSRVIELGSGFSTHGLQMTEEPNFYYLETDLPGKLDEKRKVANMIVNGARPNLHFMAANAVTDDVHLMAEELLPPGPIVVVAEGVLPYLAMRERWNMAYTIKEILRARGGSAILTDVITEENTARLQALIGEDSSVQAVISKTSGRSLTDLAFRDRSHVVSFFSDAGFRVTVDNLRWTLPQLDCVQAFGIDRAFAEGILAASESVSLMLD